MSPEEKAEHLTEWIFLAAGIEPSAAFRRALEHNIAETIKDAISESEEKALASLDQIMACDVSAGVHEKVCAARIALRS